VQGGDLSNAKKKAQQCKEENKTIQRKKLNNMKKRPEQCEEETRAMQGGE
jgi:hypothetical protein